MADVVLVLTPILVFGAILLLGFAGCTFDPSAVGSSSVSFKVRVPNSLSVTEIVYRAVNPDGEVDTFTATNPPPGSTEGTDNLFFHTDGAHVIGGWMVACRVTVRENGATAQGGDQVNIAVDMTNESPTANFRASGTPSAGNFDVAFTGVD